jgi:flagellin
LNVALENVTSSDSDIRDANFAVETSNLTRAQILVQAGTSVLSTANSTPQNVLKLLQ